MTAADVHRPDFDIRWDFDNLWDYAQPDETERRFREILSRAEGGLPPAYEAELLTQIARTQGLQRRFDEAHATLDGAEALLPSDSSRAHIRLLLERGRVFNSSRQQDRARPLFEDALELARGAGEDFHAVDAAHMLAIVAPPEEALQWNLRAITMAEASADPVARGWLGSLYNNTGWALHNLHRYDDALETFRKGLDWQTAAGKPREARIAVWTIARTLRSLGRYDEALALQRQNLQQVEATGESDGYVQEEIGECLLALGRAAEARPHLARAHAALSADRWHVENEPDRLQRLHQLSVQE